MSELSGKVDIKKRLHKAAKKGQHMFEASIGKDTLNKCKFGIETVRDGEDDPTKSFTGGAHIK